MLLPFPALTLPSSPHHRRRTQSFHAATIQAQKGAGRRHHYADACSTDLAAEAPAAVAPITAP